MRFGCAYTREAAARVLSRCTAEDSRRLVRDLRDLRAPESQSGTPIACNTTYSTVSRKLYSLCRSNLSTVAFLFVCVVVLMFAKVDKLSIHGYQLPGSRARYAREVAVPTRRVQCACDSSSSDAPTVSKPSGGESAAPTTSESPPAPSGNLALAAAGVALGLCLAFFTRGTSPSLEAIQRDSVDFDSALLSGRPTIAEFYADWCTVCKQLVPTAYEIEQEYKGSVNYSMINVDNPKWAPELAEYGVRGVPQFVFFDSQGRPVAAAAGKIPEEVLKADADALARGTALPYARIDSAGVTPVSGAPSNTPRQAGPLDHS